jgi:hypothetical protein
MLRCTHNYVRYPTESCHKAVVDLWRKVVEHDTTTMTERQLLQLNSEGNEGNSNTRFVRVHGMHTGLQQRHRLNTTAQEAHYRTIE